MLVVLILSSVGYVAGQGLNACLALQCPFNTLCNEVVYHCATAPCAPKVECVPRENSCLTKRCGPNEQCVVKRKFCARMQPKILVLPECAHMPTCVPKYPRCPQNEVYRECNGIDCENTCAEQNKLCTSGCGRGGCVCEQGLVRHEGRCIVPDACPKPECPLFEVWEDCPGKCKELGCANADDKFDMAACKRNGCGAPRCMCYPGYVRDSDNSCVPKFFCSQGGSQIKAQINELLNKDSVKITPIENQPEEFRKQ